jgi:hypothetical protein
MGVCAFVASGVDFDVDSYVRDTPLEVLAVFHKGEVRPDGGPETDARPDSGFVAYVSEDDFPHLLDQVGDAVDFLEAQEKEFERLQKVGAKTMLLDFRVRQQHTEPKVHTVPPELVQSMSRFGMGFVFSVEVIVEEYRRKRWFNPRRR